MAPFFMQKEKLWVSSGLEANTTITLTLGEPLPDSVLRYLRIQRLDAAEIAAMLSHENDAASKMVSHSNEYEILTFLVQAISGLLNSFESPLEKLEMQLAEGLYTAGSNSWSAAHVSLGEQRVLRSTKTRAQSFLTTLESRNGETGDLSSASAQCAKCKQKAAQLMRCGRCKGVQYCGRPCQVAHYKEHKSFCQAASIRA
jgi:hypothetical protein